MKKKILICNEFSGLNTGYGMWGQILIKNLIKSGNYEVAEMATYASIDDVSKCNLPWKIYPVEPNRNEDRREYESNRFNQFGAWRFERVVLDFKPDIVFDMRDFWMAKHEMDSPLRDFYSWYIMPPIDSFPIHVHHLDIIENADAYLTPTQWAADKIREQTGGRIKIDGVSPYMPDYDVYHEFSPAQKVNLRRLAGIPDDSFVVGTVMRNQARKLFPDLFKSFSKFINSGCKNAKNAYLYIHTAYPEKDAWDIPSLINEYGIGNRTLCSYICQTCGVGFSSVFVDARTRCISCGSMSAIMPNVKKGYTLEQMAKVYNIMDLYVQYSNCEGLGMPVVEAAACNVPVCGTDFSAIIETVGKCGGQPIKVLKEHRNIVGNVDRAIPDNNHFIKILTEFGRNKGLNSNNRNKAMKYFCYENGGKILEALFDLDIRPKRSWNEPPKFYDANKTAPQGLSNKEFTNWIYEEYMCTPNERYKSAATEITRDLNYGVALTGDKVENISREKIYGVFQQILRNRNHVESVRCGLDEMGNPDYIMFANARASRLGVQ